jgi:hypothetical protein
VKRKDDERSLKISRDNSIPTYLPEEVLQDFLKEGGAN